MWAQGVTKTQKQKIINKKIIINENNKIIELLLCK